MLPSDFKTSLLAPFLLKADFYPLRSAKAALTATTIPTTTRTMATTTNVSATSTAYTTISSSTSATATKEKT